MRFVGGGGGGGLPLVRIRGVSVIARCPQGESRLYFSLCELLTSSFSSSRSVYRVLYLLGERVTAGQ